MNSLETVAIITGCFSVATTWISARSLHATKKVSAQVKPVSNGFAADVQTKLTSLDAHLVDLHADVREVRKTVIKHLAAHGEGN